MTVFSLRLYVSGDHPRSRAVEQGLRRLCAERFADAADYTLEVVDLEQRPGVADEERIVATPTIDRVAPLPLVRVVGELGSSDRLGDALGLPGRHDPPGRAVVADPNEAARRPDRREDPS